MDGRWLYLVDDDDYVAEMLSMLLEKHGWKARAFQRAEAALEAALAQPPFAIVLDIGLSGGIDGFEAARRVRGRKELAGVFVVALTGYSASLLEREVGLFDGILTKPVDVPSVLSMLGELQAAAAG